MANMTPKQTLFVAEYLANGLNATKAAISAGYSRKTARSLGQENLTKPDIAAAIASKSEQSLSELSCAVERTLREVSRLAFYDVASLFHDNGALRQIEDIDEDTRPAIAGLEVSEILKDSTTAPTRIGSLTKVKLSSRLAALDMLMRYHALYKDKVEISGQLILSDRISRARVRTALRTL